MAQFKAKIIKIGNSKGIRIPNDVITSLNLEVNNVITFDILKDNVITAKKDKENVIASNSQNKTKKENKIKHQPFDICPKHKCFYQTCGC